VKVLLILSALLLLYFSFLGRVPLLETDEARYAEIPREMLSRGDFITPRLNGVVYLEKPPLVYWGNALGFTLFGQNEFGARFFTAAVSVVGILFTYWMGGILHSRRTGLYAASVLATSPYYYVLGRFNTLDMTLAVTLAAAIFPAYLYVSGRKVSRAWLYLGYAMAGLAFLTKGLVGIVFPVAILVLWALFARRYRDALRLVSGWGILICLAIVLPWVVLVQRANPDFLWFFFVREHFLRYATKMHGRYQPFWFFLPIVMAGLLPWMPFLPPVLASLRGRVAEFFSREDRIFLSVWALFVLMFFSASGSKLVTYVAPVYPPLAVLFGRGLEIWANRGEGRPRIRGAFVPALLLGVALLGLPIVSRHRVDTSGWWPLCVLPAASLLLCGMAPRLFRRSGADRVILSSAGAMALFLVSLNPLAADYLKDYRSMKQLSSTISARVSHGDLVAQYRTYRQGVPFYTGRTTILVEELGELEYGASRAKDRAEFFLNTDGFLRLWNSERRVFCVLKADALPSFRTRFPNPQTIHWTDAGIVVVNSPPGRETQ
jgi:4-amino-4-deoxy-L-arabinose transferase-like glycosyltransferase